MRRRNNLLKWVEDSHSCIINNNKQSALEKIQAVLDDRQQLESLTKWIDGLTDEKLQVGEYLNLSKKLSDIFFCIHEFRESSCSKLPVTNLIDQVNVFAFYSPFDLDGQSFVAISNRLVNLRKMIINNVKEEEKQKEESLVNDLLKINIDYKECSVLSSSESELFSEKFNTSLFPHRIKGSYGSWEIYANNMFHMLKEDFMMDLRTAMLYFSKYGLENVNKDQSQSVFLYERVKVKDLCFRRGGTFLSIALSPYQSGKKKPNIRWESTKRLLVGSLLLICSKDFNYIYFATISEKPNDNIMNQTYSRSGFVEISIQIKPSDDYDEFNFEDYLDLVEYSDELIVIESKNYYESYCHFLIRIQNMSLSGLPFKKFMIEAQNVDVPPPKYLSKSNEQQYVLDLRMKTNNRFSGRPKPEVSILKEWPLDIQDSLDEYQIAALKNMLTSQLSIVQGPPGTGKTYVGALAVKILLENKHLSHPKAASKRFNGPIIVICQTNHALDQFLMHISKFTKSIIRIGGRSRHEELKKFTLSSIKQRLKKNKIPEYYDFYQNVHDLNNMINSAIDNNLRKIITNDFFKYFFSFKYNNLSQKMTFSAFKSKMDIRIQNEIIDLWCNEYREDYTYSFLSKIAGILRDKHIFFKDQIIYKNYRTMLNSEIVKLLELDLPKELFNELIKRENQEQDDAISKDLSGGIQLYRNDDREEEEDEEDMLEDIYTEENRREENQQEIDWDQRARLAISGFTENHHITNLLQIIRNGQYNCWSLPSWCCVLVCSYLRSVKHENLPIEEINNNMRLHIQKDKEILEKETGFDLEIIKKADIVGMTLTGSAKYSRFLEGLKSEIIIIEEAAEVLEAQNLPIFTKHLQHLILIGDHKQLRPKCFNYELEKKYNMNISLFERLINNRIKKVSLQRQWRMRPDIADFVRDVIYNGNYTDHESVSKYPNIQGFKTNVFFINHSNLEEALDSISSASNVYEVKFLIRLALYLVYQGYKAPEITILTFYLGQMFKLRKEVQKQPKLKGININTVDNYQGEENEVILLSLVRSNTFNKLGFIKEANRVCVALSRAKMGMYVIGNLNFISKNDITWRKIVEIAKEKNCFGDKLILYCETHKLDIPASRPEDFDSNTHGICKMQCNVRKNCGHICTLPCHKFDHNQLKCQVEVEHTLPCKHSLKLKCYETKYPPKCKEVVIRKLPCTHEIEVICSAENPSCEKDCIKEFKCGHKCKRKCYIICSELTCSEIIKRTLLCGHKADMECSSTDYHIKWKSKCEIKCEAKLPCGHTCQGTCETCLEGTMHPPCQFSTSKELFCGHMVKKICSSHEICSEKKECCKIEKHCIEKCKKCLRSNTYDKIKNEVIEECKKLFDNLKKMYEWKDEQYLARLEKDLQNAKLKNNLKPLYEMNKELVSIHNKLQILPYYITMKPPNTINNEFPPQTDLEIKFVKHLERLWDLVSDDKCLDKFSWSQIEQKLTCLHEYFLNKNDQRVLSLNPKDFSFSMEKFLGFSKGIVLKSDVSKKLKILFIQDYSSGNLIRPINSVQKNPLVLNTNDNKFSLEENKKESKEKVTELSLTILNKTKSNFLPEENKKESRENAAELTSALDVQNENRRGSSNLPEENKKESRENVAELTLAVQNRGSLKNIENPPLLKDNKGETSEKFAELAVQNEIESNLLFNNVKTHETQHNDEESKADPIFQENGKDNRNPEGENKSSSKPEENPSGANNLIMSQRNEKTDSFKKLEGQGNMNKNETNNTELQQMKDQNTKFNDGEGPSVDQRKGHSSKFKGKKGQRGGFKRENKDDQPKPNQEMSHSNKFKAKQGQPAKYEYPDSNQHMGHSDQFKDREAGDCQSVKNDKDPEANQRQGPSNKLNDGGRKYDDDKKDESHNIEPKLRKDQANKLNDKEVKGGEAKNLLIYEHQNIEASQREDPSNNLDHKGRKKRKYKKGKKKKNMNDFEQNQQSGETEKLKDGNSGLMEGQGVKKEPIQQKE